MPVECEYDAVILAGDAGNLGRESLTSVHIKRAGRVAEVSLDIDDGKNLWFMVIHDPNLMISGDFCKHGPRAGEEKQKSATFVET